MVVGETHHFRSCPIYIYIHIHIYYARNKTIHMQGPQPSQNDSKMRQSGRRRHRSRHREP